jgi:hypothetical protein
VNEQRTPGIKNANFPVTIRIATISPTKKGSADFFPDGSRDSQAIILS